MKKRNIVTIGLAVVLLTFAVGVSLVLAGTDRSPTKDTSCYFNFSDQCANSPTKLQVEASDDNNSGCAATIDTFVGWDLTGITQTIGSGELTMTATSQSTASGTITFELYAPDSDAWTEDGTAPGHGTQLATATLSDAGGTYPKKLVFGGTGNTADANAIGAHFDARKGGVASVGIRMISGCGQSATIFFEDREGTVGGVSSSENEPDLILKTGPDFTAVDFYSFRSGGTADMTMIGLGLLVAVGLLVGTGYTLAKRRRA